MYAFYEPTAHARQRAGERAISDDELLCALGRGRVKIFSRYGIARFYDPHSRVTVVVNVRRRRILTVYRY